MTINEYNTFNEDRQREVLLRSGVLIAGRQWDTFKVMLYQIDGFYIEVLTDRKVSVIPSLKSFDCMELLDPYLEGMDLTDFYDGLQ